MNFVELERLIFIFTRFQKGSKFALFHCNMNKIQILKLRNSESDNCSLTQILRDSGVVLLYLRIAWVKQLTEFPLPFSPEVILLDYQTPSSDYLTALRVIKDYFPGVPIILLTNQHNEQAVVDGVTTLSSEQITEDHCTQICTGFTGTNGQKHVADKESPVHSALEKACNELHFELQNGAGKLHCSDSIIRIVPGENPTINNLYKNIVQDSESGFEHFSDVVARFDTDCRCLFISSAIETLTGTAASAFISKRINDFSLPEKLIHLWEPLVHNALQTGEPQTSEIEFPILNTIRHFRIGIVPERDEKGQTTSILSTLHDITDLKNTQGQLIKKNRELNGIVTYLEELDRLKTEFVSIASHEIRTPLTSILAFAQTLRSKEIEITPEEQDRYLAIIESEGKRLGVLLSDLLDISRIESGKFELRCTPVDLNLLINETINSMKLPDDIRLDLLIPREPEMVFADGDRIRQVITNLIDNATKYGSGQIHLSVEHNNSTVKASIHDNGPGIPAEEVARVFEKFYRAKTRKNGKGTGLGLAISKGIIEAHGGKIWAESEYQKGSTFSFELPLI